MMGPMSLRQLFGLLTGFILLAFCLFSGFAWLRMEQLQVSGAYLSKSGARQGFSGRCSAAACVHHWRLIYWPTN